MHKLFDKILASRITEVFQNHQEAYLPDDWEKLRAKMKQQKKGIVIFFPIIAKAASVVLFLGLSVFTVNDLKQENRNYIGTNTTIKKEDLQHVDTIQKQNTSDKNAIKQESLIALKNKKTNKFGLEKSTEQKIEIKNKDSVFLVSNDTLDIKDSSEIKFVDLEKDNKKQKEKIKKLDNSIPDSLKINLLDDDSEFIIVDKKGNVKRFDFGVEVASVSNYAIEGEGSSFNVGGGISTSMHISKNISFSTGLLMARQSMNYNQNQSSEKLMANKDAMSAAPNSIEMVDLNTAESTVEFIGIDIPLNVQFKLKRIILTTGISSLLYVQEKYSYSYNSLVTNTNYNRASKKFETQNTVNQVETQEKSDMFNRFDFAHLLNIAVGYNFPLGKGGLVFEPYVKLPIGNISSQEIKMGSGGFAVRYNF